jgi:hypothetical protein
MTTQAKVKWSMKGDTISACNCDWGCPCNFNAPPSEGNCQGVYAFHINEGSYGRIKLDGITIGMAAHAPGALHLGNITLYVTVDEKASPGQREALGNILGGKLGGPFAVFASLTSKLIGPEFVPVEWHFDRVDTSRGYVRLGDKIEIRLDRIKNPVSGKPAGFTLNFSDGLLTDKSELMTTSVYNVNHPQLSFSHPGKYGQTFQFNFSGEG